MANEVEKKIEDAVKPLEEKLEKLVEGSPVLEKVIHVVEDAIPVKGCGVTLFGWDFSLRKSRPSLQTRATSEAGVNTESTQ